LPRPKAPERERYANGRAKPLEGPTPETAKKHQERAQALHIPASKEAGYAESTIGVLEARGMISIEQAELCKKLATLRAVLYGSGNARCSSIENVSRGLPNDAETKHMRETWTAYKAATADIEQANRRLFEHVILRNSYREWMKLPDFELFMSVQSQHLSHVGITVPQSALSALDDPDNTFRDSAGAYINIKAKRRELRLLLRVVNTLAVRMPKELRAGLSSTGYTAMSEAQRNALEGDEKLCELYAQKEQRSRDEPC
jgi:hypothetical protein